MTILKRLSSALFMVACAAFAAQAIVPLSSAAALQTAISPSKKETTLKFLDKSNTYAPLTFDDSNDVIIFPVIINGIDTWALLDTGSGQTIIDTGLIKQIGGKNTGRTNTIITQNGETKIGIYDSIDLTVPGQFRVPLELPAIDMGSISRKLDKKIGIVIGYNIIRPLAIFINTQKKHIYFRGGGNIHFGDRPHFNIPIENGIINGAINGTYANFWFDSGHNGDLMLPDKLWDKYIPNDKILNLSESIDIFGVSQLNNWVDDINFSLGPDIITQNIRVRKGKVVHKNTDAYIGYGFLKGRIFILDYSKRGLSILKED